jgi:hypothetical protein
MSTSTKSTSIFQELVNTLTGFPFLDTIQRVVQIGKRLQSVLSPAGIYEVLDYESTLEIKDSRGEKAVFSKREKVRYLQNNIIAYQDQAWGDGEILLDYRSTPGKAVDFYRPGRKTIILISIQNIRQFGDEDEFHIEWGMKNCFLRERESWETSIDHPTHNIRFNIIFPSNRSPKRVMLIEDSRHKSVLIGDEYLIQLTDGRWMVHWETSNPRLHERYILQWDW